MPTKPQYVDFTVDDRAAVLTVMRSITHDRDGWINFAPSLEADELPPTPSAMTRVFGPKGPEIPFGTWVPGARKRNTVEPTSLGLQHGSGPKAIIRLRGMGITVPEGWRVLADHPRRGIVLAVPDGIEPEAPLDWLLRAAPALTSFALPKDWRAAVHRRG